MRFYRNPGTDLYLVERHGAWYLIEKVLEEREVFEDEAYRLRPLDGIDPRSVERAHPLEVLRDVGWHELHIRRKLEKLTPIQPS